MWQLAALAVEVIGLAVVLAAFIGGFWLVMYLLTPYLPGEDEGTDGQEEW